jgi:molybdopterin synthase catalytic subunit
MLKMTVRVTTQPIDFAPLVESVRSSKSGAVVLFLGTVRDLSDGKSVAWLDYEAYPGMAERELARIVAEANARWRLHDARVLHRFGRLELGDVAVAVVTAGSHRSEAFDAARWIMDEIKKTVPIWKREQWSDGSSTWSHPETTAVAPVSGREDVHERGTHR